MIKVTNANRQARLESFPVRLSLKALALVIAAMSVCTACMAGGENEHEKKRTPESDIARAIIESQLDGMISITSKVEAYEKGVKTSYATLHTKLNPKKSFAMYAFAPRGIQVVNDKSHPFYEYYSTASFNGEFWLYQIDEMGYPGDIFDHGEAYISELIPPEISGKGWLTGERYRIMNLKLTGQHNVALIEYLQKGANAVKVSGDTFDGRPTIVLSISNRTCLSEEVVLSPSQSYSLIKHIVNGIDVRNNSYAYETTVQELTEVGKGYWIPKKMMFRELENGIELRRYTTNVDKAEFIDGASVEEESKRIVIPKNYRVHDLRYGTVFKMGDSPDRIKKR